MNESSGIIEGNWVWGSVWVFYAIFYGRYFAHIAHRLKPDLRLVAVQGSPERLAKKVLWCNRFALFMAIPTVLEAIRSTQFTSGLISVAPCLFGLWVMRSVWSEVFQSKIPKVNQEKEKLGGRESDSRP